MSYYSNPRLDVIAMLPEKKFSNILEIGGGMFPTLLSIGEKDNATTWGVDVFDGSPNIDRFLHGSLIDSKIDNKLPDYSFDLILANDVLEHIIETEKFFEIIARKKKQNGLVVLSVPNARQLRLFYALLVKGSFPREDAGLFDRTHVRWFCRKDVLKYANNVGLKLAMHKTSGRLVPNFMSSTRLSEFFALHNLFVFK